MKRVCVIVPAYNEAPVIADVIRQANKAFAKAKDFSIDIVVIDDGSKDTTAIEAAKGGATVVNHILNSGAGGATLTGLAYARQNGYDIAATMDADGQHAPKDVLAGIAQLNRDNADLLIGSRLINSEGMSKTKIIGNKGLGIITYILFGINSTDSQSGLRIYSRRAIEMLDWRTTGYEFCSEMLWRAKQIGLTIDEFPIQAIYTDYSKGKGQNNWNGINIVKHLFKQRLVEFFE
ncbi:MAG TPA: glycosyltransferase family 2 protein [Candidatus Nanoperiomorbaceae bacterium]|nr:glycosyltransferase family 2 protein [Candidatus Nanoperiomorbaceae bacterium]